MQWVTIKRRSGEEIPINPAMVCYVRRVGSVTIVAMANGHEHRVSMEAPALAAAFVEAMGTHAKEGPVLEEAPAPPDAPGAPASGAPAPDVEAALAEQAQDDKAAQDGAQGQDVDARGEDHPRHKK
jgi:hypothetical protein